MLFRYGVLSSPGWHIGGPPCHSYPKLLSLYKLPGELAVVPLDQEVAMGVVIRCTS